MKTESEKCLAGMLYNCHSPQFIERKILGYRMDAALQTSLPYTDRSKRYEMLKELFGSVGNNVSVGDGVIYRIW